MKLSDYMVDFLAKKGITDFFGYQGTMIAHFVDSVYKNPSVQNHICYNEQGASFAACGYATTKGSCACAYATSGPGAINLVSGIANAYYDSIPVIFITGQVNTYECHYEIKGLRQQVFQETDVVGIVEPVCKYAVRIDEPEQIRYELEKAYEIANSGRKGPVVIDLPMNIQRADINPEELKGFEGLGLTETNTDANAVYEELKTSLAVAKRPVVLIGNGASAHAVEVLHAFAKKYRMPIVTSLLAKDRFEADDANYFGYVGAAYGHRYANWIVAFKADLIITVGMSMCTRQTGTVLERFAPHAKLIRFDIDSAELMRKVKEEETSYLMECNQVADLFEKLDKDGAVTACSDSWLQECDEYKKYTVQFDDSLEQRRPNKFISALSEVTKCGDVVVGDVGQHMMWVGQSFDTKQNQKVLFSGGHGAMGYALPAAIGASTVRPEQTVYAVCGDGAFQMNIQELQWLVQEQKNIVAIVMNNQSLGLITQQQDAYFEGNHFAAGSPYFSSPNFAKVAEAYGIAAVQVHTPQELKEVLESRDNQKPMLVEVLLGEGTFAYPKTALGAPIYKQEPLMPEDEVKEFWK
ncbi:MAG: thiamine pyrophosphate-binding protein [Agathobacter sp.]|uniref:thiamine pyrophosphate-binding protein n=1 Tax=Agathobacter sp. TaxID=2021311 RepID=UPI0025884E95|nr:thiamine pyrophosphate-binding protein [Agathobacter sp.]MCR5677789.1 thiamine pyrophosphate-binding protein [Agathobacter sp.]